MIGSLKVLGIKNVKIAFSEELRQEIKRHIELMAGAINHSNAEITSFLKVAKSFVLRVGDELLIGDYYL